MQRSDPVATLTKFITKLTKFITKLTKIDTMKITAEKEGNVWNVWERLPLDEFTALIKNDLPVWNGLDVPEEFEKFTPCNESDRSSRSKRGHDWDLGAGWKEACRLSDEGWTDAPNLQKLRSVVAHAGGIAGSDIEVHRQTSGPMIDVGAFAAGHPEAFFDFAPEPAQPVIKIGYDICSNCNIDAKDMALRGAVVYNIAEWLKPYAVVEVVAYATTITSTMKHTTEIVICNEEFPLDTNGLAFFSAHPAVLRRLLFSWAEQHPDFFREMQHVPHGGYGRAGEIATDKRPEIYFGNTCPRSVQAAGSALRAAVEGVRKEYFHEQG